LEDEGLFVGSYLWIRMVLTSKILKQLHHRNLPPKMPFLKVSIEWVEGFENYLQQLPYGTLTQPLPDYRSTSMVTIREFSTVEELAHLFPSRLKKVFCGDYAILDPPFYLQWSKSTQKLSAKFTYTAYLSNGKRAILMRSFKRGTYVRKNLAPMVINPSVQHPPVLATEPRSKRRSEADLRIARVHKCTHEGCSQAYTTSANLKKHMKICVLRIK